MANRIVLNTISYHGSGAVAEIYMKIAHLPRVNTITDDMMHQLEARFGVKGREGYLD